MGEWQRIGRRSYFWHDMWMCWQWAADRNFLFWAVAGELSKHFWCETCLSEKRYLKIDQPLLIFTWLQYYNIFPVPLRLALLHIVCGGSQEKSCENSSVMKDSHKSYKGLNAYNNLLCGWVKKTQHHLCDVVYETSQVRCHHFCSYIWRVNSFYLCQ